MCYILDTFRDDDLVQNMVYLVVTHPVQMDDQSGVHMFCTKSRFQEYKQVACCITYSTVFPLA